MSMQNKPTDLAALKQYYEMSSCAVAKEDTPQAIAQAKISHATMAMAVLQSYSKYKGAEDILEQCKPQDLNRVRNALLGKGYIQRVWNDPHKKYQLTSLGADALEEAMKGMVAE